MLYNQELGNVIPLVLGFYLVKIQKQMEPYRKRRQIFRLYIPPFKQSPCGHFGEDFWLAYHVQCEKATWFL